MGDIDLVADVSDQSGAMWHTIINIDSTHVVMAQRVSSTLLPMRHNYIAPSSSDRLVETQLVVSRYVVFLLWFQ